MFAGMRSINRQRALSLCREMTGHCTVHGSKKEEYKELDSYLGKLTITRRDEM